MINHLMQDKIDLIKKNGETKSNIAANVQKNKIFISSPVQFEEGDTIEYVNPVGVKERFHIEYVNLVKNRHGQLHHIEINYYKISK